MAFKTILKSGLQANYNAIETKDADVLYFCTDTQKIYKGDVDYTNSVVPVSTKPTNPAAGKVYVIEDTDTVEAYINDEWVVLSYPTATSVDENSDDLHVVTAKAVYDAISAFADSSETLKGVEAGEAAAQLKVTKGDDSSETVTVPGVVTKPEWDETLRKLTFPVTGDTAVEINLGKDIFLDPTAENGFNKDTGCIEMYLNDGSDETEPTLVSIPASALVDIYTGAATDGATTTVSEDNVISVTINVDPDENNALVLTADGLKVDLSELTGRVDAIDEDLETLMGDATVEGSVAKQVADSAATLDAKIEELATATTTWGSF